MRTSETEAVGKEANNLMPTRGRYDAVPIADQKGGIVSSGLARRLDVLPSTHRADRSSFLSMSKHNWGGVGVKGSLHGIRPNPYHRAAPPPGCLSSG